MRQLLLGLTFFLSLTVSHAQTIFQKTYGGIGVANAYCVQQTLDSGYIIVGEIKNSSMGAYSDTYLMKTSQDGSLQWTKTFGGTNDDYGYFIQQTNDGGYILTGSGSPNGGVYLLKTDSNGNLSWVKTYGGQYDWGQAVKQTSDGGFIVLGNTYAFGAGNKDIYLVKTASDGTLLWTKTYGGVGLDIGLSAQQTNDGGYIITGFTRTFQGGTNSDVYLIKTDSNGNLLWSKTFGGSNDDYGYSVWQTNDDGYIVAGNTDSFGAGAFDIYVIKTNSAGDTLWTKTYGGIDNDDGVNSVQQTSDGGYIIGGSTNSFGAGNRDIYLIRTDSSGNPIWSKTFGGINDDNCSFVRPTNDSGFIALGGHTSSNFNYSIYLIKTNSSGASGCNESNPNTIFTLPATIVTNPATLVGTGGTATNPTTQTGIWVISSTLCFAIGINEITQENLMSIFPNPFSTQTTLQTDKFFKDATLTVYNLYGQTVKQIDNLSGQTIIFHRDNLPSGLYLIRLIQDNKIITADKLVITDN